MSDYDLELVQRYKAKGLLLDTNLLLLYALGRYDIEQIEKFKRTRIFSKEDFEVLQILLAEFKIIVTTPNILTEVNSLSNQLTSDIKLKFLPKFAELIASLHEIYLPSIKIARTLEFIGFGLTDAGIAQTAQQHQYLVLTADVRLHLYLLRSGIDSINFNLLRPYF